MTEYFIDKVSNMSVQGSVISIDLARMIPTKENRENDKFVLEKRLTVTMTGQNFVTLVNTLNQSVREISERQKKNNDKAGEKSETANSDTSQ